MLNKGRGFTFFCVMLILFTVATATRAMSRRPQEPAYVEGQVVIKFQESVSGERIGEIIRSEKGAILKVLKRSGLHLVQVPDGMDVMEAAERYRGYPEVASAEPNFEVQLLEK